MWGELKWGEVEVWIAEKSFREAATGHVHCRTRVFTTFCILEISYISNVFLGFICHSKMAPISRNYTKIFLPFFYVNLYKIPCISRKPVTFYTNFSTIHHRQHILHTGEKLQDADWGWGEVRQYTPQPPPPPTPHRSRLEVSGGRGGGNVARISTYVK